MTTSYQNHPARRSTRVGKATRIESSINNTMVTLSKLIPRITKKIGCTFLLAAMATSVVAQKPNADLTTTSLET